MIAKPIISPDFTIEDIHKIREYHYELTKDMTTQERINFYNEGGRAFLKEMEENTGFFGSIAAFFKNLLAAIIEFFQGLFGS